MGEVKWIKLIVNIFDDTKIKLIEKLPQGDTIIVIWFKLLCLAGKSNENGAMMINSEIAFNEDMLIAYLDREPTICKLALQTFQQYKMIEIVDNIFLLANWEKHQNIDGLNTIREQNRIRQQRYRDNKKLLLNTKEEKDKELDIENERYVTLRKPQKKKYLDFVKLKEEEHTKLVERYGKKITDEYIDRLNDYIGSKDKRYKSHYHTILAWIKKDNVQEVSTSNDPFAGTDFDKKPI
ncbi:replisome organizer [PinkBerry-associated phage LS06-2018-MD08]|nr:replisome organizer [PinkBerry-associated phage LS06-2018-MD08]